MPALLSIYRIWHNWCAEKPRDITPAMRMGLAARPLNIEALIEQGPRAALEEVRRPLPTAPARRPQPKVQARPAREEEYAGPGMG